VSFKRRTVEHPAHFEGIGLHTGVPVRLTVHPSSGGIFFRIGNERVRACPENVSDTTRSTRLGTIGTVEHLMSAFAGLEITDSEVELTAPEVPGMDGSSSPFVSGLREAGLTIIGESDRPDLYRRVFLHEGNTKIAVAKGSGHWRYVYETVPRWPGSQEFEIESVVEGYGDEISRARTFALSEEIPMIQQMGLGKGLDESSALILGQDGYINAARFEDEPARHKLLDLVGDLYLSGIPIRLLNVVAERSGHTTNVRAAAMLTQAVTA
jgi:UDP-3-O-[3-hydroxymyristoyl] N-acetylglucosamine deacetylase